MNYLTDQIKNGIITHSSEEFPSECCGIIYKDNQGYELTRCENVSKNKEYNFCISPLEYLKADQLGDIKAYYHSHTKDKEGVFSDADKKNSRGHGIPLIMYCVLTKEFLEYK